MAVSANEFWQQISRFGIVDAATCRAWIDKFQATSLKQTSGKTGDTSKPVASDAVMIAQFLIANGVLNKFQSQRLLAGRGSELRLGEYLILDRCDQAPLSRWYFGRHLSTNSPCIIYPCTDALTSSRWVDPEWLNVHKTLNADGLQPITLVTVAETDPWRGAIVSELRAGRSMQQWLADQGPLDHATVASVGQMLANSLAAMHAAGLVHGELRPSRVWCDEGQSIWLLRDAGRPPAHPADPPQEHRWFDDDSIAELYAAPELAISDSVSTAGSDLFSLGALLFELATGRTLLQRGAPLSIPAEIAVARDAGATGDPLMRTLAFATDPNPEARFADVAGFARALAVVTTAYETVPAPQTTVESMRQNRVAEIKPVSPSSTERVPVQSRHDDPRALATGKPEPVKQAMPKVPPKQDAAPPEKQTPKTAGPSSVPETPKPTASHAAPPVVKTPSVTTPGVAPASLAAAPLQPKRIRRRPRRSHRGPIIIASVAIAILLGVVVVILQPSVSNKPAPSSPRPPSPSVASTPPPMPEPSPTTSPPDNPVNNDGYELVQDERLLWAAPWSATSAPPSLEMIPPGSQLVASLRLNQIIGDSSNLKWLDWMGQELGPAIASFESRSGLKAGDVERLTIAMAAGGGGFPKATYTVTAREPLKLESLTKSWNVTPSRTPDGKTIYSGDASDAYYFADSGDAIRTFVFGPVELVKLVAEHDGAAIPLARSLQQLWDTASVDADVVAIAIPNFLFADGREILNGHVPKAVEPLRSLLIPDVAGAILSMSVVDRWYVEMRLTPSGTVSAAALLKILEPRVLSLPNWAESFAIDADVDPSWRGVAIRLPQYMRALTEQTRFGVSETLPTVNFYLPSEAAPQVTLATILALSSANNSPTSVVSPTASPAPLTIEQMLESKLSVSFDQESLQFAVTVIRDEFARTLGSGAKPPAITIVGGDLEKAGITQNQQIRNFQMRDKPLRDALTELTRQANPDKSVTALTEIKQSLVWAIDPAAADDSPSIVITTRAAAAAKKIKLPKEFVAE